MRRYLLYVILFMLPLLSAAVTVSPNIRHIGVKEGLSNGFVNDMTLDCRGFLWVATNSGLNRISGSNIERFTRGNSEIPSDEIVCLFYDARTSRLWMGTRLRGIGIYDCNTGKFTTLTSEDGLLSHDIADISRAADGGLWILHRIKGIQHYDPKTDTFTNYPDTEFPELAHHTRVLVDDGAGKLYVGQFGNGLTVVDVNRRKAENFKTAGGAPPNNLISNYIRIVKIDSRQNVWIGTNKGVVMFNPTTRQFRPVPVRPGTMNVDNIYDISETLDGHIVLASDLGEVTLLDLRTDSATAQAYYGVQSVSPSQSGLSSPNVRKICEDGYGNIWVGHYSTGVDFIPSTVTEFKTDNLSSVFGAPQRIYGIDSDYEGNLWIGGENSLALYRNGTVVRRWDLGPYLNRHRSVVSVVYPDRKGNIWLGVNDVGVIRFDVASDRFEHIDLGQTFNVGAFLEDRDGRIWIGTEVGPANSLYSYRDGVVTPEKVYNDDMPRPTISALMKDSKDRLWVGTMGKGLFVFETDGVRRVRIDGRDGLPSNNINQLYQDSDGNVWVATDEALVKMADEDNPGKMEIFNHDDGLAEDNIRSVCEDLKGNIWVSTYSGVSCLRKGRDRFENYDYRDGLPESGFSAASVALIPDGTLYWGSIGGLSSHSPHISKVKNPSPAVRLVSVENVTAKGNRRIFGGLDGDIRVPYDENSLRIHFSVDNYAEAPQTEYSYLLEGVDREWQYIGNDNSVYFKNLAPGKYRLKLRARLKNGEWNDANTLSLNITVSTPLWQTWWAITLYIIAVTLIVWYVLRSYKKRLKLHSKYEIQRRYLDMERKRRQEEQDLNAERMRFYTNVAHELRTPLTLILGPLEDLAQDKLLPAAFVPQIKSIHGNSVRLLNLINQIMEFRKMETQNRQLSVVRGSLSDLITEIGLRYKELYKNENVEFRLSVEPLSTRMYFDREIITTIVNNFISNAIKYTGQGHITLSLDACMHDDEQYARISVEDTGYGIEADVLPRIYDRYFQAKGKHQASGTGIGLALVKSLAELHKGLLRVESKLGVGSTFSFLIRMDEIYPDAIHQESPEPEKKDEAGGQETSPAENRPVVLVVEDNADIRDYVGKSLLGDYTVISASNGNEGLDMALRNTPDIIVSDIMMPGMSGIELCRTLKADIRTSHIPVILLTAKDTTADKEEGYESGADSYLTKPFSAKLLKTRIANLLEGRRRLSRTVAEHASSGVEVTPHPEPEVSPSPDVPEEAPVMPRLSKLDREFLDKLDTLINDNMTTAKIDMAFLTDNMFMSHSTFYRKVKGLTGLTPVEYVRKVKLGKSIELLKSRDYSIAEISYMTGFNSPAHYREAFKDEYGMSPSQFLKNN